MWWLFPELNNKSYPRVTNIVDDIWNLTISSWLLLNLKDQKRGNPNLQTLILAFRRNLTMGYWNREERWFLIKSTKFLYNRQYKNDIFQSIDWYLFGGGYEFFFCDFSQQIDNWHKCRDVLFEYHCAVVPFCWAVRLVRSLTTL